MSLAQNRKAKFDYECLDKYEAGLELTGQEVKSVREGGAKIDTGHIVIRNGELWLIGANIQPYKKASHIEDYDPARSRKLIMHKKEINQLIGKLSEKGLTAIPFSLYTRGNRIKLEVWLARGKKTHEKRQKLKERDIKRETDRFLRGHDL
ncbi:MAG: SsrA-binding protein SmpB [Patescibacteria group bacterium]